MTGDDVVPAGHVHSSSQAQDAGLVFFSRIDIWLVLCVGAAIALCFFLAWSQQSFFAFAMASAIAATVFAMTFPCKYTLKASHLEIRCGLLLYVVPLADITRVELSRSIVSAPALSLRRVRISCGRKSYLVSPKNRGRFMKELGTRMAESEAHRGMAQ